MNIQVIRKMALGDVLCITPILRRLRLENPDAHIVVATGYPDIFKDNPHIDSVNTHREWDRVVDLDMAHETRRNMHAIDAYMQVAFGDFGEGWDKSIEFYFPKPSPSEARVAAIHANASWRNRSLPKEWWDEATTRLQRDGFEVVALGTGIDYCPPGALDTRNTLNLQQQAAAIEAANVFICGASGLFILAAATMTPVVVPITINTARTALPWRNGEQGCGYYPIVASVSCVGCNEKAGAVTYLGCADNESYRCIPTIKAVFATEIADLIAR